tara:strand:+ start:11 stop:622 length:612 start_codon:yes stop_codon:yes gene_type:complete
MKTLQITLFILASLSFATQALRHVHLYFYGNEASVLEQYQEFSEQKDRIEQDASIDSLISEYKISNDRVIELESGLDWEGVREIQNENEELYSRIQMLESEIEQREGRSRDVRDILIFSFAGFVLIIAGAVFYRTGREWKGMSLIIPGFVELVWWTKPDFFGGGAFREYGTLLIVKILISSLALVVLYFLHKKSVNQSLGTAS